MKKYLSLIALLVLTACGGGSGGGSGASVVVDNGAGFNVSYTNPTAGYQSTNVNRQSNLDSTAMIDNGSKREEHIAKMYADAGMAVPIQTNGALNENLSIMRGASVKGNNHSNGASNGAKDLFENMHEWCSAEKLAEFYNMFPDDMTEDEINDMLAHTSNLQGLMNSLRHALVLAGYGLQIKDQGNHYVIHLIKDHGQEIIDNANEIYDQMGQFQEFDITQAELYTDGDQIKFTMDGNKINGIKYIINPGQTNREQTYAFTKQDDAEHTYHVSQNKYFYEIGAVDEINGHDYDGETNQTIEIEYNQELTPVEIIDRLIAQTNYLHNTQHWFANFMGLMDEDRDAAEAERDTIAASCTNCTEFDIDELVQKRAQEIAAEKMYNNTITRLNTLRTAAENGATFNDLQGIDNHISSSGPQHQDITINLETYGKDVGLAFADFGKMYAFADDEEPGEHDYQIVYGGYPGNVITPDNIANDEKQTFTGRAFGHARVAFVQNHSADDDIIGEPQFITLNDNSAKLTFQRNGNNTATETLSASFDNWYDMLMTKTGDTANLSFSNYTYKDNNNEIDNTYRFLGDKADANGQYAANYDVNKFTETRQINFLGTEYGRIGTASGDVDIQYYGANNTPSEVVGYVSYSESEPMLDAQPQNGEDDPIKNVGFDIGFGMTKDYAVDNVQP